MDGVITIVGLEGSYIEEANPLMALLYHTHPLLFIFVKFSLSALIYAFIRYVKFPVKKLLTALTYTAITLYILVFVLHSTWIYLLIYHAIVTSLW